ncbi:hypothetical protein AMTR_s00012p00059870 [Amborella trichopoda]|uniref:Uncharacterized protein n=1 Tax=Amborella trichopoda TaxID=13333 RepID=W1PIB6_AMBTC|nr:hypothetical protein AMTR_s00012p00059870 [Amborella trichopoda]
MNLGPKAVVPPRPPKIHPSRLPLFPILKLLLSPVLNPLLKLAKPLLSLAESPLEKVEAAPFHREIGWDPPPHLQEIHYHMRKEPLCFARVVS